MQRRLIVSLVVLFAVAILGAMLIAWPAPAHAPATSTSTSRGQLFTYEDKVKVSAPLPGDTVGTTFTLKGEARGPWYFEAVFPVQVVVYGPDNDRTIIAKAQAHAGGQWTTGEYVPFTVTVTVTNYAGPATLVLLKDNPSGLPENDDSVEIPIVIK